MRFKSVLALLAMGAVCVMLAGRAVSGQEAEKADKPGKAAEAEREAGVHADLVPDAQQQQEMIEMFMRLGQPGKYHELLDHFVGEWDVVTKSWMGGLGSSPTTSQGTVEVEWILGKRFLQEKMSGQVSFPGPDGVIQKVPFEGIGFTGYDNYKNMYVSSWVDNMSTSMFFSKGSVDPSGKVFTYYGEMDEPGLGVHGRMVKSVVRIISEDKHVYEMYDLHAGPGYKVMEIVYTRKKAEK